MTSRLSSSGSGQRGRERVAQGLWCPTREALHVAGDDVEGPLRKNSLDALATVFTTSSGRPIRAMQPRSCSTVTVTKRMGLPVISATTAARSAPVSRSGPVAL